MTINKSQGQSLNRIGLYLPQPLFSHGQLYVALSRATSANGLKILINNNEHRPPNYTKNIVMATIDLNNLEPGDSAKTIEVKVYRTWISRNPPNPAPVGYCCILLDRQITSDVFEELESYENQVTQTKISGNIVEVTLWEEMAQNFDKPAFDSMTKPVILAISSCRSIEERGCADEINFVEGYKAKYDITPPLPIDYQRYNDTNIEKTRNRIPLAILLEQNPDTYKSVRFTCEGQITDLSSHREWYHLSCTTCSKKLTYGTSMFACRDHGPQPQPNYRYSFKGFVCDGTATATSLSSPQVQMPSRR
ncbi:hypothetical protein OSB04_006650 [Centaurea solstitialis]|uniref:Replication protein A OB domain-containing protein n=1 Tax=Centaurea solstitialis TaxID=347529 RepID=A0AA38TV11_9ASTR|nr:hypothetical protein OSB04_006650 [Centaurea solstitialis]